MTKNSINTKNQKQAQVERPSLHVKKNTIWALLALLFFKIALDLSYYFAISPVWSYAKFELDLNSLKLVESYLMLFIIFIFMPKSPTKLSNILVWLLILLSYIPMLTIFAFADEDRLFMYSVTGFWLLIFLLLRTPMPDIALPPLKQSGALRYLLFICLGMTVVLMAYSYSGLSFNFDLTTVYDIRAQYFSVKAPLAGYLINWIAYIVNPIFFALFISKRNWLLVAIITALQLVLFSATGFKSYFFALPFVLVLAWIIQRRNPLAYLSIGLAGIILLGVLCYWFTDNIWVSSLFTRRTLLVPAQLSFLYYDFFSKNALVLLSYSKLGGAFDYPYHLPPGNLIAEAYFGRPEMNATTGVVGDAYMNFGFIGLVLWCILLVIILKLVDMCSKGVDPKIGVAGIAMPAWSLTNGALMTNILTHGLLLTLVLLYLLPKEAKSANSKVGTES